MYVGWLLAFWATPKMTVAHFLFAGAMTAYILIAIYFEERDLITVHDQYADYRKYVPMLIPRLTSHRSRTAGAHSQRRKEGLSHI
jgi:protein-S-isoprenylcysteine O-methyltransferase Ste14